MGYFKNNIVPGHWRWPKGSRQPKLNPGYDNSKPYSSRRYLLMRGLLDESWYKPKGAPTKRGNKRGQSKPR